jgi:predicted signal transduction protein with EAL and GGDEF domain
MLDGLRNILSPTFVPYSDPKATIPLERCSTTTGSSFGISQRLSSSRCTLSAPKHGCARVNPTRGIVPPAMFLPGAGGDAMHALTERVILTALGDWKDFAWRADSTLGQRAGVGFGRSANSPDAARGSPACRELAGFDPWRLLKTRSFTICSWRKTAEALRELKCDLSVDDFGAGYSSFARLTQLPFSELKIDRAYVANCSRDQFNAGLCETIVELGRRFGLRTVAEGIETAHESHKLQSIGCQIGQGFLLGKPMPKTQLVTRLRSCLNR